MTGTDHLSRNCAWDGSGGLRGDLCVCESVAPEIAGAKFPLVVFCGRILCHLRREISETVF